MQQLSTKKVKLLHQKKYRQEMGKFLVEGEKNVLEVLDSTYAIYCVFATKEFATKYKKELNNQSVMIMAPTEIVTLGTLEKNNDAIAVVEIPKPSDVALGAGITLVLDDIRDPGNLGTLIRIADWYGVDTIVCSPSCVDWYNPKVISASMGSFTRVRGCYTELVPFLKAQTVPILGAFLDGASVHTYVFPKKGIVIIGSESHGISKDVQSLVTNKVTIPRFGKAESLNAGVAGAIILDRWKGK